MLKAKDKEKNLENSKRKWYITYKGTPERLAADFPAETVGARGSVIIIKLLRQKKKKSLSIKSSISSKDFFQKQMQIDFLR